MRSIHVPATALIIVLGALLLAGCASLGDSGSGDREDSDATESGREAEDTGDAGDSGEPADETGDAGDADEPADDSPGASDADEPADDSPGARDADEPADDIAAVPEIPEEAPDDRSSRERLLETVQQAVSEGNLSQAIDAIAEADAGDTPPAEDIQLLWARLLLADGRFTEASEKLEPLAEESVESRIMLAQLETEPEARIEAWRYALALDSDSAEARAGLGQSLLERGDVEAADEEFTAALEENPDIVPAMVGKSEIAYRRDNRDARVEWLERAVAEAPEAGYLRAELARALIENRQQDDAIEEFSRAIELEPGNAWHYADRGRTYQRQDRQSNALEDFNSAISHEDSVFLFYFYRANTLYELEEYARALEDYEKVIQFRPDYSDAWGPLAGLLFRYERYERAAEYFARSYGRVSSDPSFLMLAALSYREAGRHDRANSFFAEIERTASRDSLYYDMAREYQNPRNDSRMEGLVRRESNRNMQTRMRFYLGTLYFEQGRERAAEYLFLQVRDAGSTGFVESELAEVYLERIEEQRSAE